MKFSGRTTASSHKGQNWQQVKLDENVPKALRKVFFLDVQWSTCPVEIEKIVKDIWVFNDLGNDQYIYKTSLADLEGMSGEEHLVKKQIEDGDWRDVEIDYATLAEYLKSQGVTDPEESVVINWWW